MKKRVLAVLVILAMMLTLTGCGDELYEMTDKERQIIVDYAAHIIAKYNIRQPEGYTYVYEPKVSEEEEEDFSEFDDDTSSDEEQTEEGTDTEDTEDINHDSHSNDSDVDSTDSLKKTGLSEALGLGTLKAVFTGAQYCLKYDTFVPEYGCGLCVVNITIENPTDRAIKLDMLSRLPKFKARINDQVNLKASITILLDDLSTFQGDVPANGSVDTVVIFQFQDDSIVDIEQLSMSVDVDGKTSVVDLL